ncbi:MAG: hypothetical protein GF317_16620 [Candidatus Lokiarchaeota archaeon]|nr:hypothetical protein [Candidatus Lokiarchaeota archaeon]MBD3201144.1 hypothetical protein [Candidatus Lokiarchaeota archaeon]
MLAQFPSFPDFFGPFFIFFVIITIISIVIFVIVIAFILKFFFGKSKSDSASFMSNGEPNPYAAKPKSGTNVKSEEKSSPEKSVTKICQFCGEKAEATQKFCLACGEKIE